MSASVDRIAVGSNAGQLRVRSFPEKVAGLRATVRFGNRPDPHAL